MQLGGKKVGDDDGERREHGRQEHANVAHVDGEVEEVERVIEDCWGDHEARVNCAADDASERIPDTIVEPVVERVEAFVGQKLGRSIVEVRVKFVDDRLVAEHREQACGKRYQQCQISNRIKKQDGVRSNRK